MGVTATYDRLKSSPTNSTGIDLTIEAGEQEGTPAVFGGGAVGLTGITEILYKADLDESGGADIQTIAKFEIVPQLSAAGLLQWRVDFTPIDGAAVEGTVQSKVFAHDDDMDTIQADGGRARQA